jgi:membrane protein implicated in regulation of membrane protease activity
MFDWVWWVPWTAALSGVALVAAWRAWRRRDRAAVVRRTGYALLPWAALLLGLYGLVWQIGSAAALWAGRFVFDPTAWLGIATAALSIGLIVVGRRLGRSARAPAGRIGKRQTSADAELSDVEAILRKHGIS